MQPQHVFYNFEFVSCRLLPPGVTLCFLSSSVEDDSDTKRLSKEDKGRSPQHHQSLAACVASASGGVFASGSSRTAFLTQIGLCVFPGDFLLLSFFFFSPSFVLHCGFWVVGSKRVTQGCCMDGCRHLLLQGHFELVHPDCLICKFFSLSDRYLGVT